MMSKRKSSADDLSLNSESIIVNSEAPDSPDEVLPQINVAISVEVSKLPKPVVLQESFDLESARTNTSSQYFRQFSDIPPPEIQTHDLQSKTLIILAGKSWRFDELKSLQPEFSLWAGTPEEDMSFIEEYVNERNRLAELELIAKQSQQNTAHDTTSESDVLNEPTTSRIITPSNYVPPPVTRKKNVATKIETTPSMELEEKQETSSNEPRIEIVSKAKDKMKLLNKFLVGHTCRKVTSNWDIVEKKYMEEQLIQVIVVRGPNGISYPMKHFTLRLSDLTILLCSTQIQIRYKELHQIYGSLGYTPVQIDNACRMAAVKLVMQSSQSSETLLSCERDLIALSEAGEPRVRLDLLREAVFPEDPEERQVEIERLERLKAERAALQEIESKRKQEGLAQQEARRIKAIADFDRCVKSLQYPRGMLTAQRLNLLKKVLQFASEIVAEAAFRSIVSVDPFVVDLIGTDMFPEYVSKAKAVMPVRRQATLTSMFSHGDGDRIGYEGQFRIPLQGPPPVLTVLHQAVTLGQGLYGTSFRDVIELLQAYAATRLQSFYRAYARRWRYRVASRAWKHLYNFLKSRVFIAWQADTRKVRIIKIHCMRKVVAWRFFAKSRIQRKRLFRICFWPFYVWRRDAIKCARAREKTKFLIGRVIPTIIMMRIFRGWKEYHMHELDLNRRARGYFRILEQKRCGVAFRWYRWWTHRRRHLRQSWLKRGYLMRARHWDLLLRTPFQIWYVFTTLRKKTRRLTKSFAIDFRKTLLPLKAPHLPPVRIPKFKFDEDGNVVSDPTINKEVSPSTDDTIDDKLHFEAAKKRQRMYRKLQSTSDVDHKNRALSDVELHAYHRQLGHLFRWSGLSPDEYEVDKNEEELKDTSLVMNETFQRFCASKGITLHESCTIAPESYFHKLDKGAAEQIRLLGERFHELEVWSLLESAMRFHRVAHRTFRNLLYNARIRRNARNSVKAYRLKQMRIVFNMILDWSNRIGDGVPADSAEGLSFQLRRMRLEKMKRRRDAVKKYKMQEQLKKQTLLEQRAQGKLMHIDSVDDVDHLPIHNKRQSKDMGPRGQMRRLSVHYKRISLHAQQMEELRKQQEIALAMQKKGSLEYRLSMMKRKASSYRENRLPPVPQIGEDNMIYWDRKERDAELDMMQTMLAYGRKMLRDGNNMAARSAQRAARIEEAKEMREKVLRKVYADEEEITAAAIEREMEYMSHFREHAAAILIDVLYHIHEEIMKDLIFADLRIYFRQLRLPMLLKRSIHMRNRKMLSNQIRLANRLIALNRNANMFRCLKLKWGTFNRWLKYFEKEHLDASPNLIGMIKRRAKFRTCFSSYLSFRKVVNTVYPRGGKLKQVSNTTFAMFQRWKQYVQDEVVFRLMEEKAAYLHRVRLLEKCFWCMRTSTSVMQSYELRQRSPCYAVVRVQADASQISKRYFSHRRRSLSYRLEGYQKRVQWLLIREAKRTPTFKRFITGFRQEVTARIMMEQKLLLTAFEKRGTLSFDDIIIHGSMMKINGDAFCDPLLNPDVNVYNAVVVPAGYVVLKFKIAMQVGMGVVGWQTVWGGDGVSMLDSPPRGKLNGIGISLTEIVVPINDFVIAIEYTFEGSVILGIRFQFHFDGWSKWVGAKSTISSKTCLLSSTMGEPSRYTSGGEEEDRNAGYPACYIIGLAGVETPVRSTSLGAVVRKVASQHVFSYHWLGEAALAKENAEKEANFRKSVATSLGIDTDDDNDSLFKSIESISGEQIMAIKTAYDRELAENRKNNAALTPCEEEFFDLMRIRTTEVRNAEERAVAYAKRLWSMPKYRRNEETRLFTGINHVIHLSRWIFEAMCKCLVAAPIDVERASRLYSEAHAFSIRAEIMQNRLNGMKTIARNTENGAKQQPWYGKSLLGPQERNKKRAYYDRVKGLWDEVAEVQEQIHVLLKDSDLMTETADSLLPRMQLSQRLVNNYRVKIQAVRYKASLLEKMSIETFKATLGAKRTLNTESVLTKDDLEKLRPRSYQAKRDNYPELSSLVLETEYIEMAKEGGRIIHASQHAHSFDEYRPNTTMSKSTPLLSTALRAADVAEGRRTSHRKKRFIDPIGNRMPSRGSRGTTPTMPPITPVGGYRPGTTPNDAKYKFFI